MTSEIANPDLVADDVVATLDEDNRLTRDFVDRVLDAVEEEDLAEAHRRGRPCAITRTLPGGAQRRPLVVS